MNLGLRHFIQQFTFRGGLYVVLSSFSTKLISVLVAVLVARILSVQEFGAVSFAIMIISPFLPLSGLGMDLVLLRYGAISKDKEYINLLYNQCFLIGAIFNLFIIIMLFMLSTKITSNNIEADLYLKIIILLLFSDFVLRLKQNYMRVISNNIIFSYSGFIRSLVFFVLSITGALFFSGIGYSLAFILAPLFASFYLSFHTPPIITLKSVQKIRLTEVRTHLKYAIFIGIGAVVSQFTIPLGAIMLSYNDFSSDSMAYYRVASLIPFSILFLPDLFFKSEFVHLAKNFNNKKIIRDYIINYSKLAVPLCVILVIILIFFSEVIITGLFGSKYLESAELFSIFMLGVSGAFILRQPFGSLSSASGKASLNVVSAVISLIFCLITLECMIKFDGLHGGVVAVSLSFWFSGFVNLFLYYYFIYRKQ